MPTMFRTLAEMAPRKVMPRCRCVITGANGSSMLAVVTRVSFVIEVSGRNRVYRCRRLSQNVGVLFKNEGQYPVSEQSEVQEARSLLRSHRPTASPVWVNKLSSSNGRKLCEI